MVNTDGYGLSDILTEKFKAGIKQVDYTVNVKLDRSQALDYFQTQRPILAQRFNVASENVHYIPGDSSHDPIVRILGGIHSLSSFTVNGTMYSLEFVKGNNGEVYIPKPQEKKVEGVSERSPML